MRAGIARASPDVVNPDAHVQAACEGLVIRTKTVRQIAQHLQHGTGLFGLRRVQIVPKLHRIRRLHEHRRAGARLSMNDPAKPSAGFATNRNDVAASTEGDFTLAERCPERVLELPERGEQTRPRFANSSASPGQLRRRIVAYRPVGIDRAGDSSFYLSRWHLDRTSGHQRRIMRDAVEPIANAAHCGDRLLH